MLRRLVRWSLPALAVLAVGAISSACTVTPVAVSVGDASVSTATVNAELSDLGQSQAWACLFEAQHAGLSSSDAVGTGGAGTYSMTVATQLVNQETVNLLARQYAADKGLGNVTSSQLATAKEDLQAILNGAVSTTIQVAQATGSTSSCVAPDGSPYTGQQLLAALPSSLASAQVRAQAVEERLLASGADLSTRAVLAYYLANRSLFTQDCVSVIVTAAQSTAQQLVNQLNAGASFAALAQANSLDTTSRARGGSLGCNFAESQVLQALNIQSAPVGTPIGPIQDTTSGQWDIYEVTSQLVTPFSQAEPLARRELLLSTANQRRFDAKFRSYARHADVYVNPQYGSWKGLRVVAPSPPPAQYLLAASLGSAAPSGRSGQRLQLNGGGSG